MYQDLLNGNADGVLDRELFWLFAIIGQIKLKRTHFEMGIQTKELESRFKYCGFAWK